LLLKLAFLHKNYIIFSTGHENSKWQFNIFLFDPVMTKNINPFPKQFRALASFFVRLILLLFALKPAFLTKSLLLLLQSKITQNGNFVYFNFIF
jgi:hypothetical protein